MKHAPLAFPLLALALAACEPVPPVESPPLPPAEDACGASSYDAWLGQDASVIETVTFTNPVRVYHVGDPLTMDYSPTRINIELDANDTIVRIYCG